MIALEYGIETKKIMFHVMVLKGMFLYIIKTCIQVYLVKVKCRQIYRFVDTNC